MSEILELVAAEMHEIWANWTEYMLDNLTEENIDRWKQQIKTHYSDLSESEKDADRRVAKRITNIVVCGVFEPERR